MASAKTPPQLLQPPLIIFFLTLASHLAERLISLILPKSNMQLGERRLAKEIHDLLLEANSLSTPSTFAKAAKLRRAAAIKEKELVQLRQKLAEKKQWSKLLRSFLPTVPKAIAYLTLGCWFWGTPVAHIPSNLLQPLGDTLSWRTRDNHNQDYVVIGILPWLAISARISIFLSHKIILWQGS